MLYDQTVLNIQIYSNLELPANGNYHQMMAFLLVSSDVLDDPEAVVVVILHFFYAGSLSLESATSV